MEWTPQGAYYILAGTGIIIGAAVTVVIWGIKTVAFFTELNLTVRGIRGDVTLILNNHLPHIYQRLGETYEIREDTTRYVAGSRNDQRVIRSHTAVTSTSDGGLTSGVEDSK